MMRLIDLILKYRKTACLMAGIGTSLAFITHPIFPALCLLGILLLVINDETSPKRGGIMAFWYAMGFFTAGLYWVQNALAITMGDFWIARVVVLPGLPLLLTPLWILAGYLSVRLTTPRTPARVVLFGTLIALAEFGRAFLFTGFPWNLFAYAWADVAPMIQVCALGGVYLLNTLTILWALTPAILWIGRHHKPFVRSLSAVTVLSMLVCLAYGSARLIGNPTVLRDDAGAVIVQPNIAQEDKWDADKMRGHFYKHIQLSEDGLKEAEATLPKTVKTVSVLWPETSIYESNVFTAQEIPDAVVDLISGHRFKTFLVSGLMRQDELEKNYFNSIVLISQHDNIMTMADLYDKAHLVPFGEYIPLLDSLGIKPLTGFEGFKAGEHGPKVLHAPGFPPAAALICFEAIFPWAIHADDPAGNAEWIVNASNDGWYGDSMGPRQHLVMIRYRAVEQGLPVLRTTTTGISAVIDAYGRVLQRIPYGIDGRIVTALPQKAERITLYRRIHETAFSILAAGGLALSFIFTKRKV